MKKILFVLLFVPFLSFGQTTSVSNFHLENAAVQWINVFKQDTTNSEKLPEELTAYLSTISGVANVIRSGDVITGDLRNYQVNYQKYGGRSWNVMMQLCRPITGKFTIQVKEGRYRTVISDIYFTLPYGSLIQMVGKQRNTEITSNRLALSGLEYMNKDFTDRFELKPTKGQDW